MSRRDRSGAHRLGGALGPEARALLTRARGGDEPTADDRRRVRGALLAAVGAVAGGA